VRIIKFIGLVINLIILLSIIYGCYDEYKSRNSIFFEPIDKYSLIIYVVIFLLFISTISVLILFPKRTTNQKNIGRKVKDIIDIDFVDNEISNGGISYILMFSSIIQLLIGLVSVIYLVRIKAYGQLDDIVSIILFLFAFILLISGVIIFTIVVKDR